MYWDSEDLTIILSILALIVLLIFLKLKVIKGRQIPFILIGNILYFWYFNQLFIHIPVANHTPMISFSMMIEKGISEWDFLSNYDLIYIFNDPELLEWYLYEEWLPVLAMAGVSFAYTLGFEWHRNIRSALIACLANTSLFVWFPLYENRLWGGLVDYVRLPQIYFGIICYIIGYLLCSLLLFIVKKCRRIKKKKSEI